MHKSLAPLQQRSIDVPDNAPTKEPVGASMARHGVPPCFQCPPLLVPCSGPIVAISVRYLTNSGSQIPWTLPPTHHHPPPYT